MYILTHQIRFLFFFLREYIKYCNCVDNNTVTAYKEINDDYAIGTDGASMSPSNKESNHVKKKSRHENNHALSLRKVTPEKESINEYKVKM